MAYFAELDKNNVVIRTVIISNEDIRDENGLESEQKGIDVCNQLIGPGRWIQTSYNGKFRKQFGQVGFTYNIENDVFIAPQTQPWYILDNNFDWVCPDHLNPESGLPYTDKELEFISLSKIFDYGLFDITYNDTNNKWVVSFKIHESRPFRTFHIWNAKEVNSGILYPDACTATEYFIQSMEEVTHGTDTINDFVIERAGENGSAAYPKIFRHVVALDFSPIALITYQEFAEEDVQLFAEAWKIHPQASARDIDELFRLIIEWAWSYTELNNSEPMAILCHDILRAVQMPAEVRNDLIALRPQPVARFLSGDSGALVEYQDSEQMPESFKLWISDIYKKFKSRKVNSQLNVDTSNMPSEYPM